MKLRNIFLLSIIFFCTASIVIAGIPTPKDGEVFSPEDLAEAKKCSTDLDQDGIPTINDEPETIDSYCSNYDINDDGNIDNVNDLEWIRLQIGTPNHDLDGDGFVDQTYGGDDCNDNNIDINPGVEEVCNGIDDNCADDIDEDLTQVCGEGDCSGTQTCSGGEWGICSTSGSSCSDELYCNGEEVCSEDGVCQDGINIICSMNDLSSINTCINSPDNNPLTLDYFIGFTSVCDEGIDSCTIETLNINHNCDIETCGAECESNDDCTDVYCTLASHKTYAYGECQTDCSCEGTGGYSCIIGSCGAMCDDYTDCSCATEDYCDGKNLIDYPDYGICGTSGSEGCLCQINEGVGGDCESTILYNHPDCTECQVDDDCNDLDQDYCSETEIRHNEGKCIDYECKVETTTTRDCNDGEYCNGEETCNTASCVIGTAPTVNDEISCTIDSCDEVNDVVMNIPNDSLCDNSIVCDGTEYCDLTEDCQVGTSVDCSENNILKISECYYDPDNLGSTFDYRLAFESVCQEPTGTCTTGDETITHTCDVDTCEAECDDSNSCSDNSCSETYDDYCNELKLVEYDNDKIMDNIMVSDLCSNDCSEDCTCTDCSIDCSAPETNEYCVKDICGAVCDSNEDCVDTSCNGLDGCYGNIYRDYNDVSNNCLGDCKCESNECTNYVGEIDNDEDGYSASCGDCNDNNININPGETEVPYDGIDNDCNPETLDDDLDEDGYISANDCNDNDNNINPGIDEINNEELWDNEKDDDCSGASYFIYGNVKDIYENNLYKANLDLNCPGYNNNLETGENQYGMFINVAGTCTLTASKIGFITSEPIEFTSGINSEEINPLLLKEDSSGTISGSQTYTMDTTDENIISNVRIEVKNSMEDIIQIIYSDTNGVYAITGLPVGEYYLDAYKEGYTYPSNDTFYSDGTQVHIVLSIGEIDQGQVIWMDISSPE